MAGEGGWGELGPLGTLPGAIHAIQVTGLSLFNGVFFHLIFPKRFDFHLLTRFFNSSLLLGATVFKI